MTFGVNYNMAKSGQKRKYTKKSPYWNNLNSKAKVQEQESTVSLAGVSTARSSLSPSQRTTSRRNDASRGNIADRYSIINDGILPYQSSQDGVTVRDAILLCQKAYSNIALFRNVVDMMAEFSNNDLYLEGGSKRSRKFFEHWLRKINIWKVADQYFREYFRGGNVFLYRVDGKFQENDFINMVKSEGARKNEIPIKYVMLNPYEICAKHSAYYSINSYEKVLSQYDIERLRNPITQEDKEVFNSLPTETKKQIKEGAYARDGVTMPLPAEKMYFSFYKKQDYEPFAIPFGFPVLGDLNMKQEFKNMDAEILRTVENVILLVTTGNEPDKGGINHKNIAAIQQLFQNESSGRVMVADYTTEAEFIVPDLNKVLGPEKYEVLNQDIKDGLQNIMLSDDSHSTADIKTKVFIDRLKEARKQFLNDFLQSEIKRISRNLGFRKIPVAKFKEIDMRDDVQVMRIGTRLMELGILTPEQGMDFFKNGQLPLPQDFDEAQENLIERRKKGYFNPMVGGVPTISPPETDSGNQKKKTKTPEQNGRPISSTDEMERSAASLNQLKSTVSKLNGLRSTLDNQAKKKFGVKELTNEQAEVLDDIWEKIACSKDQREWRTFAKACIQNPSLLNNLSVKKEVVDISDRHKITIHAAALIYHSSNSYEK